VRYAGAYDVAELGALVLDWRDGRPGYLADIADVDIEYADRDSFVINKEGNAIAVNAHRESGVNVLEVMAGLQQAYAELQVGPLARASLSIEQVYDETVYIYRSLQMLGSNLMLGILLAVLLRPDADYLPEGNRNLVFAFIQPPPGMNLDHVEKEMGRVIARAWSPTWQVSRHR